MSLKLAEIDSTELDGNNDDARMVKVTVMSAEDVQTATLVAPHGVDANPVKGAISVHAETAENGVPVNLGVINTENIAEPGELRLFATNANGELKVEIHLKANGDVKTFNQSGYVLLKANGDIELNGNADFAVAFNDLKTGFDQLKSDFNDHLTAFNSHVHPTAAPGIPSIPTPGTGIPAVPSAATIDPSKVTTVKLP